MKNQSFLILYIFIFISCGGNSDAALEKELISQSGIVADTGDLNSGKNPNTEFFKIRARFIEFQLGDAEHYLFVDESGKSWDFSGSECKNVHFNQELSEDEADDKNQGWGSNIELQGKWFELTYIKREQPQYIDGPVITVNIIYDAVAVDK